MNIHVLLLPTNSVQCRSEYKSGYPCMPFKIAPEHRVISLGLRTFAHAWKLCLKPAWGRASGADLNGLSFLRLCALPCLRLAPTWIPQWHQEEGMWKTTPGFPTVRIHHALHWRLKAPNLCNSTPTQDSLTTLRYSRKFYLKNNSKIK